jgi:DNA polymerase-3 subunit delta
MATIGSAEIERFIARPDARFPIVLVYGKDPGLVSERVRTLVRNVTGDGNDPLSVIRIEGDEVAAEPLRLIEEAHTIGLFGGRKAIWVRVGSKSITPAIDQLLASPPESALIIVEAGDLTKSAQLRTMVEKAKNAAALPCYRDEARDIGRLIDEEIRAAGLRIEPSARSELLHLLGGDRLTTRSEIGKLITYAQKDGLISVAHVEAVCSDTSDNAFDTLVDAAFLGDRTEVKALFQRLVEDGNRPDVLLAAALRHGLGIARMASEVANGASPGEVAGARVPYYKRRDIVARQLNIWSEQASAALVVALADATLACRRQARLAEAIAERRLLSLATLAAKSAKTATGVLS